MGVHVHMCWIRGDKVKVQSRFGVDLKSVGVDIGDTGPNRGEISLIFSEPDQMLELIDHLRQTERDWRDRLIKSDER